MPISPLDFVLLQFGSPGYYQVFLGFLLCCLQLPITFTEYLFKYYILEPPHRCQLSHREVRLHDSLKAFNVHKNEWFPVLDHSVAQYDHTGRSLMQQLLSVRSNHTSVQFDQCNVYLDPVHHWKGTQPCTNGWEFWLPNNEHNLVTEFSLVCERKYFVTILLYAVCMASIFGAIVFGFLADKWGRSKTVHLTIYLFVASSLSAYFSVDFIQFSVFYTLQVFFVSVSSSAKVYLSYHYRSYHFAGFASVCLRLAVRDFANAFPVDRQPDVDHFRRTHQPVGTYSSGCHSQLAIHATVYRCAKFCLLYLHLCDSCIATVAHRSEAQPAFCLQDPKSIWQVHWKGALFEPTKATHPEPVHLQPELCMRATTRRVHFPLSVRSAAPIDSTESETI